MCYSRALISVAIACAVAAAAPGAARAGARKVFLNGVDLEGVDITDQTFGDCEVRFDADGNVHITAKGFEIKKKPARAGGGEQQPAPDGKPTRRYFLVSKETRPGATQYDVAVAVNGKQVATVRSHREPIVMEVTRWVTAGDNQVTLVATKNLGKSGKRRSYSPRDVLEIQIGEGSVSDGVVTITRTVVHYRRTAADSGSFTDRFEFRAR